MLLNRIIDNETSTVVEYLRRNLCDAEALHFVSAYFSIYGYGLVADELDRVDEVRFLFGDPTSVEDIDPGSKDPKAFELTERGLIPNHTLSQKHVAKRCAEWVKSDSVSIRSISQSNFLHGKMYLTGCDRKTTSGLVGSSNFTKRGLGGSDQPNLEINLTTTDETTLAELQDWFNRLWDDENRTEDVKDRVLAALGRIGGDYSPEAVYYKTLYELFRKNIEARLAGDADLADTRFQDSQIWNALYEFQKDGAKSVIAKLREHNGCILADSVGLGKTYTALAVIKYFEQRNERVLVLCPRKLNANWQLYQVANNHIQNPFSEDRFGYTLLAHTDLSRDSGESNGIDLATFNWSNYDLVVIDESHNFRNSDGKRYKKLLDEIIKQGARTRVLMLSATPVNTSLFDLRSQIHLMTEGREEAFRESLNIESIRNLMDAAQKKFKEWESGKSRSDKSKLLESLGADFLRLLDGVSISRSRRQIEKFYADEMERIGRFPQHEKPDTRYPSTDLKGELSYKDLSDRIGKFKLSVYQPSSYRDAPNMQDAQWQMEYNLVGMMRTNFLKRLESSAGSLTLTLRRTITKIDDLLEKIELFKESGQQSGGALADTTFSPDADDEDEEFFVNHGLRSYHLSDLNLPRWEKDLQQDKQTLDAMLQQVAAITPERDGKLKEIRHAIHRRVENPTFDRDGNPNRKMLVFTTFKDTAKYLYDNLAEFAGQLGLKVAMISGDETHASAGRNDFNHILTNFAPRARNRGSAPNAPDIDLLIATDCISEGQNLQDCDMVLNYDIHWNPVRIIQRFGRIDRIGSHSTSVQMINYWPTDDMDVYLRLGSRVHARMALANAAATGDADPLDPETAEREIRFRDDQTRRLIEEIPDLDELDDAPAMGDFTLDHFFTQLLRYLEQNKEELGAMPPGVYAVTGGESRDRSGVIFFLRQRNTPKNRRQGLASPVHPFYFVYIQEDRRIRYGCANARQALGVFEAATVGKTEAITSLCDLFDVETKQGQDMGRYDRLLMDSISHVRQAHNTTQLRGLGLGGSRNFKLSSVSESPRDAADFDLVTWLIIKDEQ